MSGNKYSSLPDIDTAQDIYETPDIISSAADKDDEDEEEALNTRSSRRNFDELASREDLDESALPDSAQVGAKFRKAERRRGRFREIYSTSPDQSPSRSPSPSGSNRKLPAQIRLQRLKAEMEQLELDLGQADGTDSTIDSGAMIHGLSELRSRLNKLGTGETKSTSHTLLSKVVKSSSTPADSVAGNGITTNGVKSADVSNEAATSTANDTLSSLDHRLGELELLIGASNATLDESSPLPQPLLPHINRLSNILSLLSQPRQIDAVSRRLKLLQTELERYSAAQSKRQQSSQPTGTSSSMPSSDVALILQRLSPALPTIPHLLTRLRTLSTLHASASGFSASLGELEEEQRRTRAGLEEISRAVEGLEKSFDANTELVAGNLKGLQERLEAVQTRLVEQQER